MKQNKTVKIMAILAILWIFVSIVWTWALVIFENMTAQQQIELTPEQIEELQKQYIESLSGSTATGSLEIQNDTPEVEVSTPEEN